MGDRRDVKVVGGLRKVAVTATYRNRYGAATEHVPVVDARQDIEVMRHMAHEEIRWSKQPRTLVLAKVEQVGTPPYYAVVTYGLWMARERVPIHGTMGSVELYETLGGEAHGSTKEAANPAKKCGEPRSGRRSGKRGGRQ